MAIIDRPYAANQVGTGAYQCYCELLASQQSLIDKLKIPEGCNFYFDKKRENVAYYYIVSTSITLFNVIIRVVNIKLTEMIRYHRVSGDLKVKTFAIFVATFLNTGFVLLLGQANLGQTALSFIPFDGAYKDLTEDWYINIGPALVGAMLINAFYIYIDFGVAWGTKFLFRRIDQGGCFCCKKGKPRTKTKTIQQYVNLYSGPEHAIEFKYATILNTVFVTLTFGLALPLLFPIAAVTFLNIYIMERLSIMYFNPTPPLYDDQLIKLTLRKMKFAPVFMIFFSYWYLGQP